MSRQRMGYVSQALVVILVLIFGYFGVKLPETPLPEPLPVMDDGLSRGTGYQGPCYRTEGSAGFECDSGGVFAVNSGAALTVAAGGSLTASSGATVTIDDLAIADDATVTGTATVGGLVLSATVITPTAGQVITPANGLYIVNSSGAVSLTLGVPSAAGQVLYLYGDDANTVTVNDTRIRTTDGNAATFGQYDVIQWVSTASEWIHVAKSANQ